MTETIAPEYRHFFKQNALRGFDDFWSLTAEPVEPINERRGGWSGAYLLRFTEKDSEQSQAVFMKRQQGHNHFSLTHLSLTRPTLEREFQTLTALLKAEVPIPKPLYFAKRRYQGKWQAVLIIEALIGYQPLNLLLKDWCQTGIHIKAFRRIATSLASILRRLHDGHFQHNCMYTKHIMINLQALSTSKKTDLDFIRIIDLEKTRRRGTKLQCTLRDLYTLYASLARRHLLKRTEYLFFFKEYLGVKQLNSESKKLWYQLEDFIDKKNQSRGFIEQQASTPAIQFLSEH